jgi:hypothetical protein
VVLPLPEGEASVDQVQERTATTVEMLFPTMMMTFTRHLPATLNDPDLMVLTRLSQRNLKLHLPLHFQHLNFHHNRNHNPKKRILSLQAGLLHSALLLLLHLLD